jgi:hypothetical protein
LFGIGAPERERDWERTGSDETKTTSAEKKATAIQGLKGPRNPPIASSPAAGYANATTQLTRRYLLLLSNEASSAKSPLAAGDDLTSFLTAVFPTHFVVKRAAIRNLLRNCDEHHLICRKPARNRWWRKRRRFRAMIGVQKVTHDVRNEIGADCCLNFFL